MNIDACTHAFADRAIVLENLHALVDPPEIGGRNCGCQLHAHVLNAQPAFGVATNVAFYNAFDAIYVDLRFAQTEEQTRSKAVAYGSRQQPRGVGTPALTDGLGLVRQQVRDAVLVEVDQELKIFPLLNRDRKRAHVPPICHACVIGLLSLKYQPNRAIFAMITRLLPALLLLGSCAFFQPPRYDLILRNGIVYDGSGKAPTRGDVAINGDSIVAVGDVGAATASAEIDVTGLAVAPGFINMLSWSTESLIEDGRSEGEIRQGVTLEVFGEGSSMGPWSDSMKVVEKAQQADIRYDIAWTTLGEYLEHLEKRGTSPNVASFVGATTVRVHELGYADRAPSPAELDRMRALVGQAMEEGALGVGSSLIYAPAFYAKTDELIALAQEAGKYGGLYISHMRSEGNALLQAVDELIRIAREAGVPAEIYHLKAAGAHNWPKMDSVIARVEAARAGGLRITADMYTYTAGATGLDAAMPPWVQEGGLQEWRKRLQDPVIRARVVKQMRTPTDAWESLYLLAGSPDRVLLVAFRQDSLKYLTGKTLADVARMRGKSPEETAMDLVVLDNSRVGTVYFLMSEDNIRKQIGLPWVSFGSDAESQAPEGSFLKSNPHPRAYGNFTRVIGKYVRDEKALTLQSAIHKLTQLPAANLKLKRRGTLKPGYFADIVVFDPLEVRDHATYEKPHQYSTGMVHVFVNGEQVLRNGEHTGAKPGRVVRGPGWKGWKQ